MAVVVYPEKKLLGVHNMLPWMGVEGKGECG